MSFKKKLSIEADLYSLKHSHSDEIDEQLGLQEAARMNSHTTIKMVETVYAVGHLQRKDEKIRRFSNAFA